MFVPECQEMACGLLGGLPAKSNLDGLPAAVPLREWHRTGIGYSISGMMISICDDDADGRKQ